MLTKRQNLLETIHGGNPDRFVNQYEYMTLVMDPILLGALGNCPKGGSAVNGWGVTIEFPDYVPGPFPNTSEELRVIKDVTKWRDYVKTPPLEYPEEAWAPFDAKSGLCTIIYCNRPTFPRTASFPPRAPIVHRPRQALSAHRLLA